MLRSRTRSRGRGGGGGLLLVPGAQFVAPLTLSLVPLTGTGPATFTRASPAYVSDHEGVLRQAVAGEARFQGARRVQNFLAATESFANAAWSTIAGGTGTIPTKTPNFGTAPDSTLTATRLQATNGAGNGGGDFSLLRQTVVTPLAKVGSVWAKSNTGATQNVRMFGYGLGTTIAVTSTWQRLSGLTDATTFDIGVIGNLADHTIDILLWHPQAEDVTGQSNQAPSEYVSSGVLASPWHGAGVDGVKYFGTANGNYVAQNLLLQSQDFSNAAVWANNGSAITVDQTTAPDGTLTADRFTEDTSLATVHQVFQPVTFGLGAVTHSFHAKYLGRQWVWMRVDAIDQGTSYVFFDIQNGIVGENTGPAYVKAAITNVGNGWFRCSVTFTSVQSSGSYFVVGSSLNGLSAAGGISFNGDPTKGMYVWGAQVEKGPVANPYVLTTTAPVNTNVVTEVPGAPIPGSTLLGYLCEGQRTNLCLQSQTFETTWTVADATITVDQIAAPDGTLTADKFLETATTAVHQIYQFFTFAAATQYTLSFYAKYLGRQWIWCRLDIPDSCYAWFDLQNGVLGNVANGTATITALSNGWFRCSMTITGTGVSGVFVLGTTTANSIAVTPGDVTKGVYLWGAQLEAAPFASSYIPTVAAAVTRNADSLTYPAAGNIADAAGSAYAEFVVPNLLSATDRVFGAGALMYLSSNSLVTHDNTTIVATAGGVQVNALNKGVKAWSSTQRIAVNGGAVFSGAYDGTINVPSICPGNDAGGSQTFGTIRNVSIWNTALSDALLKQITTVGGTPPVYVPPPPPVLPVTAGLTVWLDASQLALADGASIGAQWTDLSGGGHHGTVVGSPAPVFKANILNGKGVVRLTFPQGRIRGTGIIAASGHSGMTVIYVCRTWGTTKGNAFAGIYPARNFVAGCHVSAMIHCYDAGLVATNASWPGSPPYPWQVYSFVYVGTNDDRFWVHGAFQGNRVGGSGGHDPTWALSGYDAANSTEMGDQDYAEFIAYDRALSDAERNQVEAYLYAKWGL